jgi:hypothetical protein
MSGFGHPFGISNVSGMGLKGPNPSSLAALMMHKLATTKENSDMRTFGFNRG